MFNPAQRVTAKLFYNLVAQLDAEERAGAVKALSLLIPAAEDGFLSVNGASPRSDFFIQCFDTLLGVALALKMVEDDGLLPELQDIPHVKGVRRLAEAEAALNRIETILAMSPRSPLTDQ